LHQLSVILALTWSVWGADFAPALQWVKTSGGSGNSSVAAAAADAQGNLYIAGATTSLDFPTTRAAQAVAGGSMLVRIDLASASTARLYPANLPPITSAAAAPADPGTLFAASGSQIWNSIDAGSTWAMVSQFPASTIVYALAVDPKSSSTVYAGTSTQGIYKSMDGGVTWTRINNGISVGGIWVEPGAPDVDLASTGSGLIRSGDGGNSWTLVSNGGPFSTLTFDPSMAGTMYFGSSFSISKSTDDGQTFIPLAPLPSRPAIFGLVADPYQSGVLFAGSSGGIYQSTDGGVTWVMKLAGVASVLAADPSGSGLYANLSGYGIVKSTDGFATAQPIGPNEPSVRQLLVSGPNLFEISAPTTDVFAMKLDNDGNVVYSTYFGGSGSDAAAALAVGSDGSLYVTGSTTSTDLPVTAGAYLSKLPLTNGSTSSFVLKLNPDGSIAWATYFGPGATAAAIAVDSAGDAFVGGYSAGSLPTTPGAYQTDFQQSVTSNGFFSVIGPTAAFVTKFNAQGTGLIYSTYVPTDNQKRFVESAQALVVDAAGDAWIGVGVNPSIVPAGAAANIVELNPTGSAIAASAFQPGLGSVAALALDADSNVYVAGSYHDGGGFPATAGAFQSTPQPAIPTLPYQSSSGGGSDAFVAKWDRSLTHVLAATLLGGELPDAAASIAIDRSGTVIVGGYTDSRAFPTHAPFQGSFSSRAGFVAGFDPNLSNLLFSTYLGDGRAFGVQAAVPDGNGNILVAGSTLSTGSLFVGGDPGASFNVGNLVAANKIALPLAPAVRLDSVQNYASRMAAPLAPGEPIVAVGAGFGNGAQIVVEGSPLTTVSGTATSIVAVLPDSAGTSGVHTIQVSSNGALSNPVYMPAAPTSPAIYSMDGSGAGQGYILNSDGTLNSASNPAAAGSAITIFIAGAGQYTLSDGYAVTSQPSALFIDGFYCNGIAATIGPVDGLPGNVYQLKVFVPDPAQLVMNNPDLKNFKFPPQSAIQLVMGTPNSLNVGNSPMVSQAGIFVNVQ
jgi:uncharacterized protein (TIGR03437 family)